MEGGARLSTTDVSPTHSTFSALPVILAAVYFIEHVLLDSAGRGRRSSAGEHPTGFSTSEPAYRHKCWTWKATATVVSYSPTEKPSTSWPSPVRPRYPERPQSFCWRSRPLGSLHAPWALLRARIGDFSTGVSDTGRGNRPCITEMVFPNILGRPVLYSEPGVTHLWWSCDARNWRHVETTAWSVVQTVDGWIV